jgi:uncharacterized protein (TIGR02118 family)
MIRVTGFYKWQEGATFDHDYYNKDHMEFAKEKLLPYGLIRLESDSFLSAAPPQPGDIIAATNAYFESSDKAQAAIAAVGSDLMENVPKYTNLKPELKMSVVTSHL